MAAKKHKPVLSHNARQHIALSWVRTLRNSNRWQQFRTWFRRQHPLCCDPLGRHLAEGISEQAVQVHHIVSLSEQPELAYVEDNCAALCAVCHGRIEMMERHGQSTQHLFSVRSSAGIHEQQKGRNG